METFVHVEHSAWREEELGLLSLDATACIYDDHTDARQQVGRTRGYLVRTYYTDQGWNDAYDAADSASGDVAAIISTVKSQVSDDLVDKLFILDKITVEKECRNQGIGRQFIKKLVTDLEFIGIDLVALTPGYYSDALTDEEMQKNNRLVRLYGQLGFEMMDVGEGQTPIMLKWLR
ncbi:hypothetical protein NCCP2716_30910 [Sporosarcina sp. NCCP-2716]|uniref:GNAT family N-acetyltransferase n=1 Tax=Sporosarcina sp. NCCP-2716 TaxID=2943679 RepID=UPI00203A76C1|nr:GNAT family N-acetyltransferase [Sporosarcina sp. NCCP-2716]GKV70593.1 hypothetical protein NCCP2716_30910 [Sporosarcina sp. NCCP-2716]